MKINRRQFGLLAGGGVLTLAAPAIISSRVAARITSSSFRSVTGAGPTLNYRSV